MAVHTRNHGFAAALVTGISGVLAYTTHPEPGGLPGWAGLVARQQHHRPGHADPNALAMVRELHAARLLTVEGYGHTAFLNPSACAQAYESAYLIDGALPPAGTTCRQDHRPFT